MKAAQSHKKGFPVPIIFSLRTDISVLVWRKCQVILVAVSFFFFVYVGMHICKTPHLIICKDRKLPSIGKNLKNKLWTDS